MNLSDFLSEHYGFRTTYRRATFDFAAGLETLMILNNNPKRCSLVVVNVGNNNAYVNFANDVAADNGIFIASNGGILTMSWRDDLELVTSEMWGRNVIGATTLFVTEVYMYEA